MLFSLICKQHYGMLATTFLQMEFSLSHFYLVLSALWNAVLMCENLFIHKEVQ